MKRWMVLSALLLGVSLIEAATTQPASPPPASSAKPNLWPQDFNPETSEDRVDTDTATDEDVIIMEEDEESEHVPGNADNETG